MLKESLIENNSILLNQHVADWRAAIKLGTDLLEKAGAIEARYYTNIVSKIEEMGPYIILAPGLAMPHARPEEGVIKTSFALVTLAEPVYFDGEDEPVSVLITLAGSDSDQHMEGLMEVTQILDDAESDSGVNLDKVLACKTAEEIYAMIDASLGA
ncbi:PTS ascorbate-specific transporter subunit IIA [[Haemophilus] ducreyi]|uniref:Ascorbate-specific PTS system EIIA component n=2 Tax=Haemophilus ducreyi TaxID=730 RepID=Q7U334_HAEDU|nr:PTS sugar transporter subunit IIA [[Haemophilus] ducreyi]AAP96598.1 PTS system Enzyme II-A permease component [[Haemophilus] ducreyi 35000HP]AKO31442.1 PTS ascorbate-specific transporter subunit IIA [[Haemophilus] ducreyi]AKO32896.1 PTS ascorbate-specific transporter subunit IIA [[Haemophilus] ducreyi]AKO34343.1 PTS ascorbate-specific transporter subunit IIA [[Haemophilus] ducreyi]AKO35787.1 PTS ascorbate-specific transporter subunit IIA [[Haemophilus] ducreyi]